MVPEKISQQNMRALPKYEKKYQQYDCSCQNNLSLHILHLLTVVTMVTFGTLLKMGRVCFICDHVLLHVVVPVPLLPGDEAPEDTSSLITETGDGGSVWLTKREHHSTDLSLPLPPPPHYCSTSHQDLPKQRLHSADKLRCGQLHKYTHTLTCTHSYKNHKFAHTANDTARF